MAMDLAVAPSGSTSKDFTMALVAVQATHIRLFLTISASPFSLLFIVHKLLSFSFSPTFPSHKLFIIVAPACDLSAVTSSFER